jgi:hypothetical protein
MPSPAKNPTDAVTNLSAREVYGLAAVALLLLIAGWVVLPGLLTSKKDDSPAASADPGTGPTDRPAVAATEPEPPRILDVLRVPQMSLAEIEAELGPARHVEKTDDGGQIRNYGLPPYEISMAIRRNDQSSFIVLGEWPEVSHALATIGCSESDLIQTFKSPHMNGGIRYETNDGRVEVNCSKSGHSVTQVVAIFKSRIAATDDI